MPILQLSLWCNRHWKQMRWSPQPTQTTLW